MNRLNRLVRAALFSALGIGLGFAFVLIPNVECVTLTVFVAGMSLGRRWGLVIGLVTEGLFSLLNPLGSGLLFPPLLLSQMAGMMIVGWVGGWWGRRRPADRIRTWQLAVLGFGLTFLFDSFTTLSFPLASGFDLPQTVGVYLSGLGFTFLHQVTNATLFSLGVPRLLEVVQ